MVVCPLPGHASTHPALARLYGAPHTQSRQLFAIMTFAAIYVTLAIFAVLPELQPPEPKARGWDATPRAPRREGIFRRGRRREAGR
jgi:hypothetical protein